MEHISGTLACLLNLLSMTMADMVRLRALSLTANAIFVLYGVQIDAYPIVVSCTIAAAIHCYQLVQLRRTTETSP